MHVQYLRSAISNLAPATRSTGHKYQIMCMFRFMGELPRLIRFIYTRKRKRKSGWTLNIGHKLLFEYADEISV